MSAMTRSRLSSSLRIIILLAVALTAGCGRASESANATGATADSARATSTRYEDLLALFTEWRTFQRPTLKDGVPDYTPSAMTAQHKALAGYQARLAAI